MAGSSESDLEFIVNCVRQYWPDISISQHLLEHPTSEFVIQVYQAFQETMNDILCRMANVESVAAEEQNPSGDTVFSILCFVNNYLNRSILKFAGADTKSLTLTDLYDPTAKRTRIILKVLLNVMLFYEDKIEPIANVVTKRFDEAQALAAKKENKEVLKQQLAVEAESLASAEDKLQKLLKEEEKVNLRYQNLEKQKIDKDKQYEEMRKTLKELVKTYENKQTLLATVKTNIESLNEQIVTEESFKILEDQKEALVTKCSELDAEIEVLGENLASRGPVIDRFDNINKEINILKSACEKLLIVHKAFSSIDEQLRITEENYKTNKKKLQTYQENTLKSKENIKAIKEALQSATVKNNTLIETMQQQLKQLKVELNAEQKVQCDIAHDKVKLEKKVNKLEGQVEEIKSKIQELNVSFANTYKNMLTRENSSTINFKSALESIKDLLLQSEQDYSNSTQNIVKSVSNVS